MQASARQLWSAELSSRPPPCARPLQAAGADVIVCITVNDAFAAAAWADVSAPPCRGLQQECVCLANLQRWQQPAGAGLQPAEC